MYLEGFISIKAAIKAKNRSVNKVFISSKKRTKKSSYMKKLCTQNNIKYEFVDETYFEMNSSSKTHGGFLADVEPRRYLSLNQLLKHNYYFWLSGVEDPYNLATNLRTIYAAGISGVILDEKDYSTYEMRLSKSSAGTYEYIDIHLASDVDSILHQGKALGYDFISIDQTENSTSLYETKINRKSIFVVGGERRGFNTKINEEASNIIHIPYGRTFGYSLPSTVATSVVAFEILRRESK